MDSHHFESLISREFLFVSVAAMDNGAGPSLYPLHRCKTLHLVGVHNFSVFFKVLFNIYALGYEGAIYLV